MKLKHVILGVLLSLLALGSCNDDLSLVGSTIQPEDDKVTVHTDTFLFEASTVLMDPLYAKTDTGLLGELYDPLYGNLVSDYICQFYCPEGYQFMNVPNDGIIDSVEFRIYYDSWVGDSLTPMRAEIFRVTEPLKPYFYTDIDPLDYCDMTQSMGKQTYTAHDMSVPDSERNSTTYIFQPSVTIRLNKEFGQQFYDETINNPGTFANQEAFNKFLPGFYVTTTFGKGNILKIHNSVLNIYFKSTIKTATLEDSVVVRKETFSTTKEVIQLNRFKNTEHSHLLEPNDEYTYVKTPAGVCTRIVIPVRQIAPTLEGRILNNLPIKVTAMPQEKWDFALAPPRSMLLIHKDSVKVFFEEKRLPTSYTSHQYAYVANRSSNAFNFGNISKLLSYQVANHPDEDLELYLIPVNHIMETNSYYGTTSTTGVYHFLTPSGMKLRMDEEMRKVVVTSSKY